jgi:endosialidase-like protein
MGLGLAILVVALSMPYTAAAQNTALGGLASGAGERDSALPSVTTGTGDTAIGSGTLFNTTSGNNNDAMGLFSMFSNTIGFDNVGLGVESLFSNTTGSTNTAVGDFSGFSNMTGTTNIALGFFSGFATNGSFNIDIGNPGLAGESSTIRIGTVGQHSTTYVAGISGVAVTGGAPVVVASNGQLGVGPVSSARFKRDIRSMGSRSDGLLKLRPVTFRYKNDPKGTLQYGVVAEEVARVYPELVVYGSDGKPLTVQYSALTAMLLNELQREHRENQQQAEQVKKLRAMQAVFEGRLSGLEQAMDTHRNRKLAAAQ